MADFRLSASYGKLLGIDGEPIEFEWNIFQGLTSLQILQKFQNDLQERNIEPGKFEDRIIFMSMFNDIFGQEKETKRIVFQIQKSQDVREEILAGTLHVPRPWRRKKWYGNCNYKPGAK